MARVVRAPLLLAAAALALAAALVVPAAEVLQPGVRSLHQDLAEGEWKPFEGTPLETPALTEEGFSDEAGGMTGRSDGTFLPQEGALPDRWAMDRDVEPQELQIDLVCDPALGAMKRLKAYDTVQPGHVLGVADGAMRAVAEDRTLRYDRTFRCTFPVALSADGPTPVYAPGPDAVPIEWSTSPAVPGGLAFLKDGADTFHVRARESGFEGVVELSVRYKAPGAYYDLLVPATLTLGQYGALAPDLDPALEAKADRVLATLGLATERRVDRIVTTLVDHFSAFGEGPIPPPTEYQDLYEAIAYGENGCCRHRAYAFMVTAQAAGVPTRVVVNEAHAFVEVLVPGRGWQQANLGGCGSYRVNNPEGYAAMHRDALDPGGGGGGAAPTDGVATTIEITDWSPTVRKGVPFEVGGVVREAGGKGLAGVRVDVFVNRTKTDPGHLVARATTLADGTWSVRADVPREAPARNYQLVAHAKAGADGRRAWLGSWSDPEIRVETATRFELDFPEVDGVDLPVPLPGRLVDALGGPVPDARVRLRVEDATFGEAVTDSEGAFRFEPTFNTQGVKRLAVEFEGDSFRDASTTLTTITVRDTSLDVPRALRGVRGEDVVLEGSVLRGGEGLAGRTVHLDLPFDADGRDVLFVERDGALAARTGADGAFRTTFSPRATAAPGAHELFVEERELGLRRPVTLLLDVRTTLALEVDERDGRRTLLATLTDDGGAPLPDVPLDLAVDGAPRLGVTDAQGRVAIPLDGLDPGAHEARGAWTGDPERHFLGTEAIEPFDVVAPPTELDSRLALLALASVAVLAAGAWAAARFGLRRRAAALLAALRARRATRLVVAFPGLDAGLPPVVAPGEPFAVRVVAVRPDGTPVSADTVKLHVAGAVLRTTTDARGVAEVRLPGRPEGVVEVRATHRGGSATARLRVADWRRAIEDEWLALVADAGRAGLAVDRTTTPRLFRDTVPSDAADQAVRILEVSSFSERPVGRAEWVAFARAAGALREALCAGA